MATYVFDVDDTLILHNKENNDYYKTPNNGTLKELINSLKYQKLYVYTNGTFGHGEDIVKNLLLENEIPRENIFARDVIPHMKPHSESFNYVNNVIKRDLKGSPSTILFFDDLIENLVEAKKIGWKTIWISPEFPQKPDYIDYAFPNIFQALLFFKESI